MNTQFKTPVIFLLAALAAAPLSAAVESVKVEPTYIPRLSPAMEMDGVTSAKLIVAVAVDEKGKLTETLVLGYTHPGFVRSGLGALQEWKFTPARIDGQPVAAQTELTIDYSAEGVVISRSTPMDVDQYVRQKFGARFIRYTHTAAELDRLPNRVTTDTPRYAKQAADQGVKGAVQVYFYIDETGAVRMPSVGMGGDPYLSQSAIDAVRGWKFEPPTHRGQPVLIAAQQLFKFGS